MSRVASVAAKSGEDRHHTSDTVVVGIGRPGDVGRRVTVALADHRNAIVVAHRNYDVVFRRDIAIVHQCDTVIVLVTRDRDR